MFLFVYIHKTYD